jgi:hypothetical protein
MPVRRQALQLTYLEDRTVPASWIDPTNLTVSFPSDGTPIGSTSSSLFNAFGGDTSSDAWRVEVLRGLQSWAAVANVNIGLVSDSGRAFGASGSIQGDSRFGDIRIGGMPLSPDTLGSTVPFNWTAGTWSGDVLLNTAAHLGINPTNQPGVTDLYTVAVHEAGHALGLDHSQNPLSVMAEQYAGAKTGLDASDIAAIQALYGPRVPDSYEGASGNNTRDTATPLSATTNLSLTADLTTATDTDFYTFVAPTATTKLTVSLRTSGLSLLTAKVTVFDAAGRVVGSDAAIDPTSGDLAVRVNRVMGGMRYYVQVAANSTNVFGIGRYKLSIGYGDDGGGSTGTAGSGNDSEFVGAVAGLTSADTYQVTAPNSASAQVMMLQVRAVEEGAAIPTLSVFDASMHQLSYQVIGNDGTTLTVQVPGITQGAGYFVRVSGVANVVGKGTYALTVDFTKALTDSMTNLQKATLAPQSPVAGGTLTLHSSAVFEFVIDTGPKTDQTVPVGTTLTFTLHDASGNVVLAKAWPASQSLASFTSYLAAGTYTVQIGLVLPAGATGTVIDFWLDGGVISDPLGTQPPPTGTGPGNGPTTTTTTDPVTGIITTIVTTTDPTTGITTTSVTTTDPSTGTSATVTTTVRSTTTTDPVTGIATTVTTTTITDPTAGTVTTASTTTTDVTDQSGFTYTAWVSNATVVTPITM